MTAVMQKHATSKIEPTQLRVFVFHDLNTDRQRLWVGSGACGVRGACGAHGACGVVSPYRIGLCHMGSAAPVGSAAPMGSSRRVVSP